MPPLVMPCRVRNPSSACTSTSKIALPIPSTSYFVSAIKISGYGKCGDARIRIARCEQVCLDEDGATYHVPPRASKPPAAIECRHDPPGPHRLRRNARLAAFGIYPGRDGGGAAWRRAGGG